ncbi:MAG: hypothetical protein OXP73_10080 [Chloroflexota bacterium]|nr:hypothetical protein [Chloroflexota bacterium]
MGYRLALIAVLLAGPAAAQEPEPKHQEFEAGGGIWFVNPLGVYDFVQHQDGSAHFGWTNWYTDRSGVTFGVEAIPFVGVRESALYGHITWRRRWFHSGGNFTHLGVGGGPTLWIYRYYDGTGRDLHASALYHVEVLHTRRNIRDGLSLRAGVRFTPLLHIPLIVQPTVMLVW